MLVVGGLSLCPLSAQEADPPPIVIEGERQTDPGVLAARARDIAGHPGSGRPLARFEDPLCLTVAAADQPFAREVAERVIENARRAKVRVRKAGCQPNALIALSEDVAAQLGEVRDSGRSLFPGLELYETSAAMNARDPVYVFRVNQLKSAAGQPIQGSPETPTPNVNPAPVNRVYSMGRLNRSVRKDTVSAVVLIDARAASGLSALQIADYASLRLLAPSGEVEEGETGTPSTILTLFAAPERAPQQMTRFDRAYLTALYRAPRGAFAKDVLRAAVADALTGEETNESGED